MHLNLCILGFHPYTSGSGQLTDPLANFSGHFGRGDTENREKENGSQGEGREGVSMPWLSG